MGSYVNSKGRSDKKGGYFMLPDSVMDHENFRRLSGNATKLIAWLGRQYNGGNNGDLSATWSQLKDRGFKSESTLAEARAELLHYGLVEVTRQGGTNKATLYALTWHPVHECKGKLDVKPKKAPSNLWRDEKSDYVSRSQRARAKKLN